MHRRNFFRLLGGVLLWPQVARAQKPDRSRRLGILIPFSRSDPFVKQVFSAFTEGLQKLGWSEGKTVSFETRYSEGKPERLPALAAELVQENIDVLVVWGAQAVDAARKATSTIPIVITAVGDALGAGYIASLAHPGGNITGLTLAATDQSTKRLQLIKQLAPQTTRVAVIWNNSASGHHFQMKELDDRFHESCSIVRGFI